MRETDVSVDGKTVYVVPPEQVPNSDKFGIRIGPDGTIYRSKFEAQEDHDVSLYGGKLASLNVPTILPEMSGGLYDGGTTLSGGGGGGSGGPSEGSDAADRLDDALGHVGGYDPDTNSAADPDSSTSRGFDPEDALSELTPDQEERLTGSGEDTPFTESGDISDDLADARGEFSGGSSPGESGESDQPAGDPSPGGAVVGGLDGAGVPMWVPVAGLAALVAWRRYA